MLKKDIPVLLLTGYLGSGKTTLLNRILQNKEGIRFAVIVNDIGEVNIDADLIEKGGIVNQQDDSLVALQNGCICCTLKMDLVQQLYDLISMRRFDYIVIEASGICEPAPIAQTICSMADMAPEVIKNGIPRLDCIVSVVDALRLQDDFAGGNALLKDNLEEEDIENLVIQQIEFCNIILLNKASDVPADKLGRIKEVIRALQPKAEIIPCDYGDVPLDKIIHTGMFDFDKVATSAAWIQEIEGHHDDDDDHDDDHDHDHDDDDDDHDHEEHHDHHHHHHHDGGEVEEYGIGTFVYYRRAPMNLSLFDDFVARRWPKNIIRAKGICYFADEQEVCYVFEQAGKQFSIRNAGQWYATMPKRELEQFLKANPGVLRDWDEHYGDRMQKLVFIGQNLDRQLITEELDKCLEE
ncbi:MAG: GTP-binding protein [Prevotella sp.]|nr:GTP-binding protein [Prevotella sp.]